MTEPDGVLDGRTALVVGGGSGIGRAVTQAFAAAGANVVAADRKNARLFIDVTDEESVRSAVAEASTRLGRIDVLVNSAGILTESPLVEMDLATWTEMCCRHVFPAWWSAVPAGSSTSRPSSGSRAGATSRATPREGRGHRADEVPCPGSGGAQGARQRDRAGADRDTAGGGHHRGVEGREAQGAPARPLRRPRGGAPTAVLLASDPGGNLFVGQMLGPNSGDVMP
jgi:3-oxoacyl-[acyl-carrier protein] reductase